MTATYKGEQVRVVRVDGRHTLIVWRGMLKRVQASALVLPAADDQRRAGRAL